MDDLKHYQCHKQVHARPMDRRDYQVQQAMANGKDLPLEVSDLVPGEPGYMVVYSKGTPKEYVSWSPKDVFDEGYSEIVE